MTKAKWLPTSRAAEELGVSIYTLKRQRDCIGGCLVLGDDYRNGLTASAPCVFNVENCRAKFTARGEEVRREVING